MVGGGSAGMQAAITAADRGHTVTLCEKNSRLGGMLLQAEHEYFKEDITKFTEVLVRRVQEGPIKVMLGKEVTPELIGEAIPDVLIAAVDAEPIIPNIPGIRGENVVIAAINFDEGSVGDKVMVIGGGLVGCEKGFHLTHQGKDVTILEMLEKAAPTAPYLHWLGLMKELEKTVKLETSVKCTK